jgi:DNA-binding NtrC family response regulator
LEDLPSLVIYFLQEYANRCNKEINDVEDGAMQLFLAQPWPGNVRELQNVIERCVVLEKAHVLTERTVASCLRFSSPHDKPAVFPLGDSYHEAKDELLDRFDSDYIITLLKKHDGNITKAAKEAGLGYRNFYEKMKKHGINKWEFSHKSA